MLKKVGIEYNTKEHSSVNIMLQNPIELSLHLREKNHLKRYFSPRY